MDGLDTEHYHADFPSTDKGWTQLRPGGTPPCGRCSHTATLVGDLLYIIGGGRVPDPEESNVFEHFNDVHALDLRTAQWSRVEPSGETFPARRGHCAGLHEATRRVFIFGGCSEPHSDVEQSSTLLQQDTWILHADEPLHVRWQQAHVAGALPRRRRAHRCAVLRDAVMVVHGGFLAHHPPISEPEAAVVRREEADLLHALDLSTLTWHTVHLNYLRTEPPLARNLVGLFGFAALGDRLLMHGGSTGRVTGLLFSMEAGAWLDWYCDDDKRTTAEAPTVPVTLQHTAAAPPLPRFGHELVEAFGHLMIFGGTAATGRELRDVRILRRLPPSPTPLAGPVLLDKQVTMQIHVGDEIDATAISGLASRYDPVNDVYGVHVADPEHPQGQRLLAMARGHLRLAEGPAPDDTLEWMADVPELSNSMVKNPSAAGLSEEYSLPRPSHRNAASLTRAGTRFVLFGGGSFPSVYLNDVWVLHTDLQPRIAPPPALAPTVLAPHFASLVGSPRFADVKFELDDGGPPLPAHRLLLASGAASYFVALLDGSFQEAREGARAAERATAGDELDAALTLRLPFAISRAALLAVLRYLYTGDSLPANLRRSTRVPAAAANASELEELLRAADGLGIEGLRRLCEQQLEAASADWDQVLDVLVTADALHCDALKARCMQTLVDRYGAVARGGNGDDPPTELEMVCDDLTCRFPDLTDGPYGDVKFGDLPGVERLQGRLRAEVEEALGVEASTSTVFRWRRVVERLRDEVLEVPASRDPERFD